MRAVGTLSGTAVLAGCSDLLDGGGGDEEGTPEDEPVIVDDAGLLNSVPVGANFAMTIEPNSLVDDPVVRDSVNTLLEAEAESANDPRTMDELLAAMQAIGLDVRDLSEVVIYADSGDFGGEDTSDGLSEDEYLGIFLDSEWSEDVLAGENEETEYNGRTLYEPSTGENTWFGVLEGGEFVFGNEDAVKDAIDVEAGEADLLAEDLRRAYTDVRSAPVRFVGDVPEDELESEFEGSDDEMVDTEAITSITRLTGAMYTDGDDVGAEMTLRTDGEDAAADLKSMLEGMVDFLSLQEGTEPELAAALEAVEMSQDGTDVTVTYEQNAEELIQLLQEYDDSTETETERSTSASLPIPL